MVKRRMIFCGIIAFAVSLVFCPLAGATSLLGSYSQGGVLANAPAYEWWYGCSPTSAGMMMGYYDRNGYAGQLYGNLVKGGVAELSSFSGGGSPLANNAIASTGHITDFWSGYGNSGDPNPGTTRSFDSLADFMGTSQWDLPNVDGSTTFYFWTNGAKFTAANALSYGVQDKDGMYGIYEYFNYAGYADGTANFYTQHIQSSSAPDGFTFTNFMAEIDAGRVVMVQVEGHSMFGFGFGYDAYGNGEIYIHDTWNGSDYTMLWGGSYSGMAMWGVTCFTPTGGSVVPIPGTLLLLGSGLAGLMGFRRRFNR